jgi:peptidoglycan/xylan/chitin deacetylase (PgdA/CDA1 family)
MIAGKRRIAVSALDRPLLRRLWSWRGVLILNYHRIGDSTAADTDRSLWSATAERFDEQLAELPRFADVIGPDDLQDAVNSGRGRHVMLTFDDGYRDNFEVAYPLLRAHGLTATFFVTTGFLDQPRMAWWDELAWMVRHGDTPPDDPDAATRALTDHYKQLPASETERFLDQTAEATGAGRADAATGAREWMTWDMVRELRENGMSIGGHTVDHPILSSLPSAGQQREVRDCVARLEEELGEPTRLFAYPVGTRDAFTRETARVLRQARVRMAFSFYGGIQRPGEWQPMDIPRSHVGPWCDAAQMRALLSYPQLFARGQ